MKKRFSWLILLLPFVAVAVLAVIIYSKSGGDDWDDDDDDDGGHHGRRRIGLVEGSAIDNFTDEEIRDWPVAPEPDWGGNSPAFRKKVAPGIVISARKNAFEQPTEVAFRPATQAEHRKACQLVTQQQPGHTPFLSFDLDAGLQPTERMPGYFTMEMDLEEMGIPENLWHSLRVNRIDQNDVAEGWNSWVRDGKLVFNTDQNSLWEIGCVVTVVGGFSAWAAAHYKLGSYYGLTRWGTLNCYSYVVEDSIYGSYTICFNPWETEHPRPDRMEYNINSLRELIVSIEDQLETRVREDLNPISGGTIPIWDNNEEIYDSIYKASIFKNLVDNNPEVQRLRNDSTFMPPQSVVNIGRMFQIAHRYIRNEQGMKPPMRMCAIYLGTKELSKEPGYYFPYFDISPSLFMKTTGENEYISPKMTRLPGRRYDEPIVEDWMTEDGTVRQFTPKYINEAKKDEMFLTVCHELFHHYQSNAYINSQMKNVRLAESTAAVLERDFIKYLWEGDRLSWDPNGEDANEEIYAPNEEKEWLLAPLDGAIMPSYVTPGQLIEAWGNYARLKHLATAAAYSPGERVMITDEEYANICRQYQLTNSQLADIAGMASEIAGGPNCNAGYMLGDLIDFLRVKTNKPGFKLSNFFQIDPHFDYAFALQFSMQINDEDFDKYYTEFCAKNIRDIVNRQQKKSREADFRRCYDQQYMDSAVLNRNNPVHKLKCWRHAGKYACRTIKLAPESPGDLFNLMVVPSEAMKGTGQEAVRAYVAKGDTAFAPQEFYLEADSNDHRSPNAVALIMTSKIYDLSLTDDHYYDAVAYYAPKQMPSIERTANGDFKLQTSERPVPVLEEKKYVTGMQFFVKNNRTDTLVYIKIPFPTEEERRAEPLTAILTLPDLQVGEEPDVKVFTRWYYQPDPNDTTSYYSPFCEENTAEGGLIIDNDSYVYAHPDISQANLVRCPKGHLKVWSDGRFEWSQPAHSSGDVSYSNCRISGKGLLGADISENASGGIILGVDGSIGNIDSTSFTASSFSVTERSRDERGQTVEVTTTYSVRNVRDAYLCYTTPESRGAPIKVIIAFPNATRRGGRNAGGNYRWEIVGYGKAEHASTNPFLDF